MFLGSPEPVIGGPMTHKTQCLIVLAALCLVDTVIPIPIVGIIMIYVCLQRPIWFYKCDP